MSTVWLRAAVVLYSIGMLHAILTVLHRTYFLARGPGQRYRVSESGVKTGWSRLPWAKASLSDSGPIPG